MPQAGECPAGFVIKLGWVTRALTVIVANQIEHYGSEVSVLCANEVIRSVKYLEAGLDRNT
jgi:hypothetical protein